MAFSLMAAVSTFAADRLRIALMPLQPKIGVEAGLAETVSDVLITEMVKLDRYDMVDRENLKAILKEQALQNSGCTESACAVKLGNILNVQKMAVGSVSKLGEKFAVTVNMVDVENSKIELSERIEFTGTEFVEPMRNLAYQMARKAPRVGSVVHVKPETSEIYMNLSVQDGSRVGRVVRIYTNQVIQDQTTGQILAREMQEVTTGQVKSIIGGTVSVVRIGTNFDRVSLGQKGVWLDEEVRGTAIRDMANVGDGQDSGSSGGIVATAGPAPIPLPASVRAKWTAFGVSLGVAGGCLATALILNGTAESQVAGYRNLYQTSEATATGDRISSLASTADGFFTASESALILAGAFGIWAIVDGLTQPKTKPATLSPRVGLSLVPGREQVQVGFVAGL